MMLKYNAKLFITGCFVIILQMALQAWAEVIVTPEDLADRVRAYIAETTEYDEQDIKPVIEILKLPGKPLVLEGDSVQFMVSDNRVTPFSSRGIVRITMSTEVETRQIGIPVRIMVEKPVWITTRLIRAREPVTMKDVMLQRKQFEYDSNYSIGSKEKITSYISKTNIPPGTILDHRNMAIIPDVHRNDDVSMVLTMPSGVSVTIYGKALEDGAIGNRIRVSQSQGNHKNRIYIGEVTGKNRVLVRM